MNKYLDRSYGVRRMLASSVGLIITLGLAFGLSACSTMAPSVVTVQQQNVAEVTTSGLGKIEVTPDIAVLRVSVSENASTPEEANRKVSTKISSAKQTMLQEGIAEADIRTENIYLNAAYEWVEGERKSKGYDATTSMEIKIRDIGSAGTLIPAVIASGINEVSGLSYEVSNYDEKYNEALGLAMEHARVKAETMIGNKSKIGEPISVSEGTNSSRPMYKALNVSYAMDGIDSGGTTDISAGTQEITAQVTVTFKLNK